MVNVRSKGQRGEREVADMFGAWASEVTSLLDADEIRFKRNLMQSRQGGYDIIGLEWLALEVKRQETLSLPAWWRQTLKQAQCGQTPLLAWKQNRVPWRFRVALTTYHHGGLGTAVADLDLDNAKLWFKNELWYRLQLSVAPPD